MIWGSFDDGFDPPVKPLNPTVAAGRKGPTMPCRNLDAGERVLHSRPLRLTTPREHREERQLRQQVFHGGQRSQYHSFRAVWAEDD